MQNKAKELLEKYRAGTCTPEETELVESWYFVMPQEGAEPGHAEIERTKTQVWASLPSKNKPFKIRLWSSGFIKVAAAILLVLGVGLWFFNTSRHPDAGQNPERAMYADNIAPGSNKAILTLANGEVIDLSGAKTGVVIDAGKLMYNDGTEVRNSGLRGDDVAANISDRHTDKNPASGNANLNTITTPRGGRYALTLSDGTKVILNAASSLKYPTSFTGNERKVELTGEAYFIVKHDPKQPFRVESRGQIVEDIGTEFNINSYSDEPVVKTTLIEGSARVTPILLVSPPRHPELDSGSRTNNGIVLTPNQQSSLTANGSIKVAQADVEEVLAWKEGDFLFRGEKIESVMRKIAYWYDVNVIYAGQKPTDGFQGKISRNRKISSVLEMLELTGAVHFKIEGRNVIVLN